MKNPYGFFTLKLCPDEEGISHKKAPLMRGFLLGGEILKVLLRSLLPTGAILRDCHIKPDLVLLYRKPDDAVLQLVRLGSHSELCL